MPHPGKTLSPHGVERPLLGVGAPGPRFYFRLWLSKLSRLTRRCLSLSAVLLALCVWLSLITVMSVAPIQQDGRIARGPAAAALKQDANFFIRSDDPSDNRGSYPVRPLARTGYLSPIDMQLEKREKGEEDRKEEDTTSLMTLEIRGGSQKRHRKAITKVWPEPAFESAADDGDFGPSNMDNVMKSSGIGGRRIHGFKAGEARELETASFPRYREKQGILVGLKSDKNGNSNDVTSHRSRQTSPSRTPVPTITSVRNQAPAPPLRLQGVGDRQHLIDNGPITIMGIRSSRQAPHQNLGNPGPNLAAPGRGPTQDNSLFKAESDVEVDIPTPDCGKQATNKELEDKSNMEMINSKVPSYAHNGPLSEILYESSLPLRYGERNSKTASLFPQLREKLTAQGLQVLKKSINSHWPSGTGEEQHNRQGNFYDGRTGTPGINSHSFNAYDSPRDAQKIEASTVNPLALSLNHRGVLEIKSNHFPTLPLANSERALLSESEIKSEERVLIQKLKVPEDNGLRIPPSNSRSFQAATNLLRMGDTPHSESNRHSILSAAGSVNSEIKNLGHSITRQRQRYNGDQGIRDGRNPRGKEQTVECARSGSRRGSNLTLDTAGSSNCSDSSRTKDQSGETRNPIYSAETFVKMERVNDTTHNLSSRGEQSNALIKKHSDPIPGRKEDSRLNRKNNLGSPNSLGVILNDGFDIYSYNATASDAIPISRSIPDTRPPG